jgi:hypothetical protein
MIKSVIKTGKIYNDLRTTTQLGRYEVKKTI